MQTELQQARQMVQEIYRKVAEWAEATKEGRQPDYTLEDYDRWLLEVQSVSNQGIASTLNQQPRPSAQELENDLRRVVSPKFAAETQASVFSSHTATRTLYVVAYGLGAFATSTRSWIGVFGPEGDGKPYSLLASVENTLPDKTIALEPLSHPGAEGVTFLAYGINWGDAHNRLTVIAYSFKGGELKPMWSRVELPQGQIKVEEGKIKLVFLSSPLGPGYKSVHQVTEIYRIGSSGIRLEKRIEGARE